MMDANQAAAILRRYGMNWPHISRFDIDELFGNILIFDAIKILLTTIQDDSNIKIVTNMSSNGKILEENTIINPVPTYKRLGFSKYDDIEKLLNISNVKENKTVS